MAKIVTLTSSCLLDKYKIRTIFYKKKRPMNKNKKKNKKESKHLLLTQTIAVQGMFGTAHVCDYLTTLVYLDIDIILQSYNQKFTSRYAAFFFISGVFPEKKMITKVVFL